MRFWVLTFLLIALSACAAPGTQQQTLVAYETYVATEQQRISQVGTVEYERLLMTLEYSETQIARAQVQQNAMIATLTLRGFDAAAVLPQQAVVVLNTPTPAPNATVDPSQPTATPQLIITPFFTQQPSTLAPSTQASGSSNTTTNPLSEFVTASSVGDDDCAQTVTNQFTTQTAEIYVVARARNTQPGIQFGSRWFNRDTGEELAFFDYTPNFAIDNECIWFYATSDDFPFTVGNYSVVLEVNGQAVSERIPFVISGS